MAFDQSTRNRLARFVSDTRSLLAEEFTRQLQNDHGLDPATGDVTDLAKLEHLDDARRETALLLRETMEHYLASADTNTAAKAQKAQQEALDRIVREQAFTVLNRLCALRMSEARGLLIESIAKGYQSKGFQLYQRLTGTALGETGDTYRVFIFSVFDEFAVDLPVLFDRFSPQGRLFPRETVLLAVLEQINCADIDPLWAEDETIGWIYQYFNSVDERREMRKHGAPRTSRELAVRNQFFTPRYVVEFLTDNTLGCIWYEMTQGKTGLKDSCHYLVRRPNEVFLAEGEDAPKAPEGKESAEDLSQKELLRRPVHIPYRPLKDPRDIKMLDPACGSMHFGLYAFDLFERIYSEAWDLEAKQGADGFVRSEDLKPLHDTYESKDAFFHDVPRLIIERSIHGIDIDPRAVQIAGLSLWLRAQKSWQAQNEKAPDRPQIQRSNIVCAEPMPGEVDMLEEFLKGLRDDRLESLIQRVLDVPKDSQVRATGRMAEALCDLVRTIWEEMKLAGEAGSLLKIEESLADAIAQGKEEWVEKAPLFRVMEFGLTEETQANPKVKYYKHIPGEEEDFWNRAEALVLAALEDYAEHAKGAEASRRRMFIADATRGFAFVDLSRKVFDVILMNPPFGDMPNSAEHYLTVQYPTHSHNILCCFISRMRSLARRGYVGSVIDRTILIKNSYEAMRQHELLNNAALKGVLDLGWGVLDANVEVSTLLIGRSSTEKVAGWSLVDVADKEEGLPIRIDTPQLLTHTQLLRMPFAVINLQSPTFFRDAVVHCVQIGDKWCEFVNGHTIKSDVFKRLLWELPQTALSDSAAARMWNGSGYSPFRTSFVEAVEIDYAGGLSNHRSTIFRSPHKHGHAGLCFGKRGDYLDVQLLPGGFMLTNEGFGGACEDQSKTLACLAVLNARVTQYMVNQYCGQHKGTGYVNRLPAPDIDAVATARLVESATKCWYCAVSIQSLCETDHAFRGPLVGDVTDHPLSIEDTVSAICARQHEYTTAIAKNDELVEACFGLKDDDARILLDATQDRPSPNVYWGKPVRDHETTERLVAMSIVSYLMGVTFGRWGPLQELLSAPMEKLEGWPSEISIVLDHSQVATAEESADIDPVLMDLWRQGVFEVDVHHPAVSDNVFELAAHYAFGQQANCLCEEVLSILSVDRMSDLLVPRGQLFDWHLGNYSKGTRVAPIYWQLSTPSGSYTFWLYYPHLTDQTLYTCVNNFIDPKLTQVAEEAARLRGKPNRSSAEEKELERLSNLELELRDFRDEMLRTAKFWKPNFNDGVQITAAPLWKLFLHKKWRARLKETWEKLETGEYDWAHLTLPIWPDRVVRTCHKDHSYATAHGLEDTLWYEVEVKKTSRGGRVTTKLEWQPRDLTEDELNEIIAEVKAR